MKKKSIVIIAIVALACVAAIIAVIWKKRTGAEAGKAVRIRKPLSGRDEL